MDEFQTTNELSIKLSIIVLKHCTIQVLLFNAYMMVLMEHKRICILSSSINNNDIALSSTVSVHNRHGNKVVGIMFAYLGCEGIGTFGFKLYLPI